MNSEQNDEKVYLRLGGHKSNCKKTYAIIWECFETSFQCSDCQHLNQQRIDLSTIYSISKLHKLCMCKVCWKFSCRQEDKLYRHILVEHFEIVYNWQNCKECDNNIAQSFNLNNAVICEKNNRTHLCGKDKKWQCEICPYTTDSKVSLDQHLKGKHFDLNNVTITQTCELESHKEICDSIPDFPIHFCGLNSTKDKKWQCVICPYTATNKVSLDQHLQGKHFGSKPKIARICKICCFKTNKLSKFNHHLEDCHIYQEKKPKRNKCDQCGKKINEILNVGYLKSKSSPNQKLVLGEPNRSVQILLESLICKPKSKIQYCCNCCDYSTSKKRKWEAHLSQHKHIKETNWNCEKCDFIAKKECHLKGHVMSRHNKNNKVKGMYFERSKTWRCHKCRFKSNNDKKIYKHLFKPHGTRKW